MMRKSAIFCPRGLREILRTLTSLHVYVYIPECTIMNAYVHTHTQTDTQAKCGYDAYVNYLDSTKHGTTYICVKTSCCIL